MSRKQGSRVAGCERPRIQPVAVWRELNRVTDEATD